MTSIRLPSLEPSMFHKSRGSLAFYDSIAVARWGAFCQARRQNHRLVGRACCPARGGQCMVMRTTGFVACVWTVLLRRPAPLIVVQLVAYRSAGVRRSRAGTASALSP